jgi:hypothetical protein
VRFWIDWALAFAIVAAFLGVVWRMLDVIAELLEAWRE